MSFYLSVDLGTTGCRSIIFDGNLKLLASSYEEYGLITPKEKWVEQDAELWWELTLQTAAAAIRKAGISGSEISSISISSQGITLVPVDEKYMPLCNAISWLDTRTGEEAAQIEQDFGKQKIYEITGKPISPAYTLTKFMWLKKHMPEIYETAYRFLMPMDFLIARFTGKSVTDHSMASGTLMYDIQKLGWSKELLDFYHIDENKLPTIAFAGEAVGPVLPEVAQKLGLKEDCMVAVGAQDQKCAAYGAGLKDGVMTVSLGTAAAITKRWTVANTHINTGVTWCGYVEPGAFVTEGVIGTAGTCLRWVRDMCFRGEDYFVIDKEAEEARDRGSSLLFHPYLTGSSAPKHYPVSTGNFYGVNMATNRGDFALAVMEGIAFQIRMILEAMEAYGNVHTLILFGGGANGALWCQIIADVTGLEVRIPQTTEAAAAGAALFAAKAVDVEVEPLAWKTVYTPSERKTAYETKYQTYKEIADKLWEKEQ